jgi:uncharacterized coiled-coil protein SlyX
MAASPQQIAKWDADLVERLVKFLIANTGREYTLAQLGTEVPKSSKKHATPLLNLMQCDKRFEVRKDAVKSLFFVSLKPGTASSDSPPGGGGGSGGGGGGGEAGGGKPGEGLSKEAADLAYLERLAKELPEDGLPVNQLGIKFPRANKVPKLSELFGRDARFVLVAGAGNSSVYHAGSPAALAAALAAGKQRAAAEAEAAAAAAAAAEAAATAAAEAEAAAAAAAAAEAAAKREKAAAPRPARSPTVKRPAAPAAEGAAAAGAADAARALLKRPDAAAEPAVPSFTHGKKAPCRFYSSSGGCREGAKCNYSHIAIDAARASGGGGGGGDAPTSPAGTSPPAPALANRTAARSQSPRVADIFKTVADTAWLDEIAGFLTRKEGGCLLASVPLFVPRNGAEGGLVSLLKGDPRFKVTKSGSAYSVRLATAPKGGDGGAPAAGEADVCGAAPAAAEAVSAPVADAAAQVPGAPAAEVRIAALETATAAQAEQLRTQAEELCALRKEVEQLRDRLCAAFSVFSASKP